MRLIIESIRTWVHTRFSCWFVLLIFVVLCAMVFFLFVFILCLVPNVVCSPGLSILDYRVYISWVRRYPRAYGIYHNSLVEYKISTFISVYMEIVTPWRTTIRHESKPRTVQDNWKVLLSTDTYLDQECIPCQWKNEYI
jgi:hypothetical protein